MDYLEAKMPDITPTKILHFANEKIQILRHAGQWNETDPLVVMALKLELGRQKADTNQLAQHIVAHLGK